MQRALQILLTIWSVAWIGIVVAFASGEGGEALLPALAFITPLAGIAALTWWRPIAGAALALAAGIFAMYFFDHSFPRLWLATPAIVLGVATLLSALAREETPGLLY